ncbi:MAG: PKD domain-containing protein [Planctomycetes bacterium]|nr:PKD domain-containing protein [Planctomycetota bacterium]
MRSASPRQATTSQNQTSRYIRPHQDSESEGSRSAIVRFEQLEARKLLSGAPLDGPWGGLYTGVEILDDAFLTTFAYTEELAGEIANDTFTGMSYFIENGEPFEEALETGIWRDQYGRLDIDMSSPDEEFFGYAGGGVDPESMVGWYRMQGDLLFGEEYAFVDESMFIVRATGENAATDLVGKWTVGAMDHQLDEFGELADTQVFTATLDILSDGTFAVTEQLTSYGDPQPDDGGIWTVFEGGLFELEFTDGSVIGGRIGDIGSVMGMTDLDPSDGTLSTAIGVKSSNEGNYFQYAIGNYRIAQVTVDSMGMPADATPVIELTLYDDGYFELRDARDMDQQGNPDPDPIQTGSWDVDQQGRLYTFDQSNTDYDLSGRFDETFSVIIGADLEWSDGQIGTIVGTRTTDKDGFFDEGVGDALPAVAMADDGSFVVTWSQRDDMESDPDVWAQMFDELGQAAADPFMVNTTVSGMQGDSHIAMDAEGNFVITWLSDDFDLEQSSIVGRLFDATGQALTDEIAISNAEVPANFAPAVAMADDGTFVVTWTADTFDEVSALDIYGQRFDATGQAVGNAFVVTPDNAGFQDESSVSMDGDGNFVVVWQDTDDIRQDQWVVEGVRYDATGNLLDTQAFSVDPLGQYSQDLADVAMDDTGAFMVVWASDGEDGDGFAIMGRPFDADGQALEEAGVLNVETAGDQDEPYVTINGTGQAVVTWTEWTYSELPDEPPTFDVRARWIDMTTGEFSDEILPEHPDAPVGTNGMPHASINSAGDFVVVWTGFNEAELRGDRFFEIFDGSTFGGGGGGGEISVDAGINQDSEEAASVEFIGDVSGAPLEDLTIFWDFGDGFTADGLVVDHAYADDGDFEAVLTVIDTTGVEHTDTMWVFVSNVDPIVDPGPDVDSNEGDLVYFDAWAEDPGDDTLTYSWDFGDGSTAQGVDLFSPTHTYLRPDTYEVILTVSDEDGGESVATLNAFVANTDPTVSIGQDRVAYTGDEEVFGIEWTEPGDDTMHVIWDFGDGTVVEGDELFETSHVFSQADQYTVTVTLQDEEGGEGQDSLVMTVVDEEVIVPDAPASPLLLPGSDTGASSTDGETSNNTELDFKITGLTSGATVRLYVDDAAVAEGTAGSGVLTLTHLAGDGTIFDDGWYVYSATQEIDGIESSHSDPTLVVIDTVAPDQPDTPFLEEDPDGNGRTTSRDLTFTGYAEPLLAVELFRNGNRVGQSTVADEGGWEVVVLNAPLGTHDYTVRLTDAAGNESQDSEALTVEKVSAIAPRPDKPTMLDEDGEIDEDNLSSISYPTFAGTADAGNLVRLYVDGVLHGTAYADSTGEWLITPTDAIDDGKHTVQASQAYEDDEDASESPLSYGLTVTIDTSVATPGAPALKPGSAFDTGRSDSDGITNNSRPTFVGSEAEPKGTVTLYDEYDNVIGTSTVNSTGSWTIIPETDMEEGDYVLHVVVTDEAGNDSEPSDTMTLSIDKSTPLLAAAPDLSAESDTGEADDDNVTGSRDLTFSGVAEEGAEVRLLRNGSKIGDTVFADDEDGTWEITVTNAPAGEADWSIMQTDAAGNVQMEGDSLTVEVVTRTPGAPRSLSLAEGDDTGDRDNDRITNLSSPTIVGSADAGNTVTLYDATAGTGAEDLIELGTAIVDENGEWSMDLIELDVVFDDGDLELRAIQTDLVGNESPLSGVLKITVDTEADAPGVPTLKPGNKYDTGRSDTDLITNNGQPVFTGEGAEAKATVILLDQDDNELGSTTASSNGTWTIGTDLDLEDGEYEFNVIQIDIAGNESELSDVAVLTVDKSSPDLADAPDLAADSDTGIADDDNVTASRDLTFSGVAETGAEVQMMRNGKKIGDSTFADEEDGTWELTVTNAPAGEGEWSIMQTDAAGNVQEDGDTLAVEIIIKSPSAPRNVALADGDDTGDRDNDRLTNENAPTIVGTADPGNTVTLYDATAGTGDDQMVELGTTVADENGDWSIDLTELDVELADGDLELRAIQTDLVGNVSSLSSTLNVTVDTAADAPSAPALKPGNKYDTGRSDTDLITNNGQPVFGGEGAEAKATVVLVDQDDNEVGSTTAGSNGSWTITTDLDLEDGEYEFNVYQIDTAGNTSELSDAAVLTVDKSTPGIADAPDLAAESDTGIADDDNVTGSRDLTFSGVAEAGAEVQMMRNGKKLGDTAFADEEDGTWELTVTNVPSGEAEWSIMQTDAAGNTQEDGTTLTVEVITKSPGTPRSLALADGDDTGDRDNDRITNVSSPTITGLADPGKTITLYDATAGTGDDQMIELGTAVVDENGDWSIDLEELEVVLTDGDLELRALQTDQVGNVSNLSGPLKITLDTTADAPGTPALKPGKKYDTGRSDTDLITNNGQPVFTGEGAEAKATVVLVDQDSNEVGSATANSSGAWTISTDLDLEHGGYEFNVFQIDVAGNVSDISDTAALAIDKASPGLADAPDLAAESDTGVADDDNVTGSRELTFSGVAELLAEVQMMRNGKKIGDTAIADEEDGTWQLTVTNAPSGEGEWSVMQTDLAGNVQEDGETLTVEVITKKPAAPRNMALADGDDTGDRDNDRVTMLSTPTFVGTADPGNTVTLYDATAGTGDDQLVELGTAVVDGDGEWIIALTEFEVELDDGDLQLRAMQTDLVGNTSSLSGTLKITVDTVADAPGAPALKPGKKYDTGRSDFDLITNNGQPMFTGEGAEAKATVTLLDQDENVLGTAVAKSNGSWTISTDLDLDDGEYAFNVFQTDVAGNVSELGDTAVLIIDKSTPGVAEAPDLSADSDTGVADDDNVTGSRELTFSGVAEAGAEVQMMRNGKKTGDTAIADEEDGTWQLTITNAPSGEAEWSVMQTDVAGNVQDEGATLTVEVITKSPPAPKGLALADGDDTGSKDNDRVTNLSSPTFVGTASPGNTVTLYDATAGTTDDLLVELGTAVADENGDWTIDLMEQEGVLADGDLQIRVIQTDLVGNTSSLSGTLKLKVDTEAAAPNTPSLKPGSKYDTGRSDTDLTTTTTWPMFTGDGAEAGATVGLYDSAGDDRLLGTATASKSGTWNISVLEELTEGEYLITVRQTDVAGNISELSEAMPLTIDTTAPTVPGAPDLDADSDNGEANDDNVTSLRDLLFTGTVEAYGEVTLFRNGKKYGTSVIADAEGYFSITAGGVPLGVSLWSIAVTDIAGNISEVGEALSVEVIAA